MDVSAPGDDPPTRGAVATLAGSIDRSLRRVREATGSALAFGGRVEASDVLLAHFDGAVVGPLRGVRLESGHGLGGRVVAQERALAVRDYVRTPLITHRYDAIIRAERLRSIAAVPVIVGRRPVAVLYASQRTPHQELDRVLDVVAREARSLEQELVVTEAVRGLEPTGQEDTRWRARARDAYAELRVLANRVDDEELRSAFLRAAGSLVPDAPAAAPVALSRREADVLALVAGGMTDRAVAQALGIGLYTVKGHVKNLLVKLHAGTRLEAVVTARRHGLLP